MGGGAAANYTFLSVFCFCDYFKEEWNDVDMLLSNEDTPQSSLLLLRSFLHKSLSCLVMFSSDYPLLCNKTPKCRGLNNSHFIMFMVYGEIWVDLSWVILLKVILSWCMVWHRGSKPNFIPMSGASAADSPLSVLSLGTSHGVSSRIVRHLTSQLRASKAHVPRDKKVEMPSLQAWKLVQHQLFCLFYWSRGKDMYPPISARNVSEM